MTRRARESTEWVVVVGDFGVVVLPLEAVELAREIATGSLTGSDVVGRAQAVGGGVIDGPGPWVVTPGANSLRVDPLREPQPGPEPAPSEAESEPAVEQDDSQFEALFGATISGRRIEDAAVREAAVDAASPEWNTPPSQPAVQPPPIPVRPPEPVAPAGMETLTEPVEDVLHDGRTMTREQFAALRAHRAAKAGETPATPHEPQRPRVTLYAPTGQAIPVVSVVVVGRRPQPRSIGSDVNPQLVVIDNPYVSSSHLEIRFDDLTPIVTDLSTNGTLITRPGRPARALSPGRPTELIDGVKLQLAEGVVVTVSIEPA